MSNTVQQFLNETFGEVRAFNEKGELWFVASDIARVLDYGLTTDMTRGLDDDETGMQTLHIRSENGIEQDREMLIVNESGVYSIVLSITKRNKTRYEKARSFKKWVTGTVITNLRKDGMYVDGEENAKTVEEFDALMNEAYDKKVLRKYGIGIRNNFSSILKENLASSNPHIYSTATDQLIYKPIFGMTAKQLKEKHNVKSLRDDVFTNEELVKLAKQEEFVGTLVSKLKDYYKVKEIIYIAS